MSDNEEAPKDEQEEPEQEQEEEEEEPAQQEEVVADNDGDDADKADEADNDKAADADKDADDAKEEPPKEEPAKEEPKEEKKEEAKPAPKVEEEKKEEPKAAAPKKKKFKKKKASAPTSGAGDGKALWQEISKKGSSLNYYICKVAGKVGKTSDLELVQKGTGGAKEVADFLKDKDNEIYFCLIKCVTTDASKSTRFKFIYLRFIGSKVKTKTKASLTMSIGAIDNNFDCKHLTLDVNESCAEDLEPVNMAKELLRVGGAHKPDKMSFGPDQDVDVKDL